MNSYEPSFARRFGRAIEDRPPRFLRRDPVIADRFADRRRLSLQPPIVGVEEGERTLGL